MPRVAIQPSEAVAEWLRRRRFALRLTLREVEARTRELGESIPHTTLARIERGRVDPGLRRLHVLLRLYNLSLEHAGELLDLEAFGPRPTGRDSAQALLARGIDLWKQGDVRRGLAHLVALRTQATGDGVPKGERQRAVLSLAVVIGSLGKFGLSQEIVHELLLDEPPPEILPDILLQAAVCWHWLGSAEAALAFLDRAESHVGRDDARRRAWLLHERASTLASMGQSDAALRALAQAQRNYRKADDRYGEARAMAIPIRVAVARGHFQRARRAAERARTFAVQHGFARLQTMRTIDLAKALLGLNRHVDARRAATEALTDALREQDDVLQFYSHHALWRIYEAQGDQQRATIELEAARYHLRTIDEKTPEALEVAAR